MNRRGFLQLLSTGAIGAATFDLERLLWVPGRKTIFLPATTVPFDYDVFFAEAGLAALHRALSFNAHVFRSFDDYHKGDIFTIPVPKYVDRLSL